MAGQAQRGTDLTFPRREATDIVRMTLDEDLGGYPGRDVTTQATMPPTQIRTAQVIAREPGVVCGLPVWQLAVADVAVRFGFEVPTVDILVNEGEHVGAGEILAEVTGVTQVLLIAERTALNIVSRMSGICTHTAAWAAELEGTGALVLDTRKTTPGLRALEKYAVRAGGGTNKRMGLYDVAMVKDNHKLAAGSVAAGFDLVRERFPDVDIQVEVTTRDEAVEAVRAGARFLLCDNMTPPQLQVTVAAARGAVEDNIEIEATGGLTLEVAAQYARTGVDYMSVGALTHSSPILDIALDLV